MHIFPNATTLFIHIFLKLSLDTRTFFAEHAGIIAETRKEEVVYFLCI